MSAIGHMESMPIGTAANRDRGDPQVSQSPDDADGDFATIGDQDALKHV